jgi:octaprenyl-diphosphate synthase
MNNVFDAAVRPRMSTDHMDVAIAMRVRGRIAQILASQSSSLSLVVNHPNLSGGKLLRSRLLFAAAPTDENALERCVDLCAVLELVHLATLFHDDVLDAAEFRRGKRTLCAEFGNKNAIMGGDFVLAKALLHLSKTASLEAVQVVSKAVVDVFSGELLQQENTGRVDIHLEEYVSTISLKTGALFRAACELAWILADQPTMPSMASFGTHAGLLYQIIDDHNDYFGNPAIGGKPIGQDFAAGVPTLPLILGLQRSGIESEVRYLFCETSRAPKDFRRMHELLVQAEVPTASSAFIDDIAQKALVHLEYKTTEARLQNWFQTLQHVLVTQAKEA